MSARQRFVANGTAKPSVEPDSTEADGQPASEEQHPPAFKDASNSPRPGRRTAHENIQNNKNNSQMDIVTSSGIQPPSSALGISKPLNIGSLARPKTKKGGDAPHQNKRDRNFTIDRLKENEPISRIRSPRPLPMSPSRRLQNSGPASPYLFGPSNATLLTEDQPLSPISRHGQRLSDSSIVHIPSNNQTHNRSPVTLTGHSFAASGQTLMKGFSPSSTRSCNASLEPARREVFPMRSNSDGSGELAHTFDSLSPPSPAQRRFSETVCDYQAPISLDGPGDEAIEAALHKQDKRVLRRATKRIGQHDTEDEAVAIHEGKRAKVGVHTREVDVEQRIDLTYEHRARPSRSSTPMHRYQLPTEIDAYHSHQSQAASRSNPDTNAQNLMQLGEGNEALCRLLGADLDRYVTEHIEQYEAAKKRWTGCTIEEWKAGAEEMSGKFSRLVDFVKDHMVTKLTLYTSLHEKVTQHKVVLDERRTMLKNMQEKLVKDSGMVLGGSAGEAS